MSLHCYSYELYNITINIISVSMLDETHGFVKSHQQTYHIHLITGANGTQFQ
jgi:hypothetical protein